MPRLRAPATPALACLVLLLAGQAAAREAVTLRWDAPASCPAAAFHAPLRRYLGARAPTSTLAVRARVREPAPGRWQLDLHLASGANRRLTAARCDTVADAAAFIVAQALADADAAAPRPTSPPPASPPPLIPDPPDPDPAPPPAPASAPDPVTPEPGTPPAPSATTPPAPSATTPAPS
ncbi:MAG: hypothetical protein JNK56_21415, partial [Myxococcales bacterium]|nr:hypothetical protein [Myxococcales bacterium]